MLATLNVIGYGGQTRLTPSRSEVIVPGFAGTPSTEVTVKVVFALSPQLLEATTLISPEPVPAFTVTLLDPSPDAMDQPAGKFHI